MQEEPATATEAKPETCVRCARAAVPLSAIETTGLQLALLLSLFDREGRGRRLCEAHWQGLVVHEVMTAVFVPTFHVIGYHVSFACADEKSLSDGDETTVAVTGFSHSAVHPRLAEADVPAVLQILRRANATPNGETATTEVTP